MLLTTTDRDFRRLEFKIDALLKEMGIVIRHEDFISQQEASMAKSLADIEADAQATLAKVQTETNALTAIAQVITDQKAKITELTSELDTAIANQADPTTLQGISDAIKATNDALDANAAAEAALTGTDPAPVQTTPPAPSTPADPSTPATPAATGPTVTSISPIAGSEAGGDTITILGTRFAAVDSVTFGGTPATAVVVNSDTSITATSPAGTGTADVVVTDGAGNASVASQFTYVAQPQTNAGTSDQPAVPAQNIQGQPDGAPTGNADPAAASPGPTPADQQAPSEG